MSLIVTLVVIGFFAELSWLTRAKLTATFLVGIILIGILSWPLVSPAEPFGVVSVVAGSVGYGGAITLAVLAFLAGLIGYFLAWPSGREIGILAAPSGLAILAVRSGNMASLCQLNATFAQRQALFEALRWEPIFWLAVVAAGFFGVLIGQKIVAKPEAEESQGDSKSESPIYLKGLFALVVAVLAAQFLIGLFAQDVRIFDNQLGRTVVGQPAVGQIVFAVLVSFGAAGFVVKKFLDVSYIWPAIASAFVTAFAITFYVKQDVLQHLVENWPGFFFSNVVVCILPVQMVAFGTIGSIGGYWLAVRYDYWRKHEITE